MLGVSCHFHDGAAALLHDGELVAAAEEERFSRLKHDFGFPHHAIDFCLSQAGISGEELDYAVFYEKPVLKFERILMTMLATFPRSKDVFPQAMTNAFAEKLGIKGQLMRKLKVPAGRILFTEHHIAHGASAFFCSPFDEAAILTADGVGEWATTTIGQGRSDWDGTGANTMPVIKEMHFPHSVGLLYSTLLHSWVSKSTMANIK